MAETAAASTAAGGGATSTPTAAAATTATTMSSTLPPGATGSGRDIHLPPRGPPLKDKYSIQMVEHSTKDNPNVFVIDADFGDGDSKRWPEEDEDMTLLQPENDKHVLWRRTAGDWLAKDMNLFDEHTAAHWILGALPRQYGLFEQITHPKDNKQAQQISTKNNKLRLDRFIFGHNGRKIRSALSLGKHISWLLHGSIGTCTCDGCKVVSKSTAPGPSPNGIAPASSSSSGAVANESTTAASANGSTARASPASSTNRTSNGTKNKKKRTVNVAASDSGDERRSTNSVGTGGNASAASSAPPAKKVKGKSRAYEDDESSSLMDEEDNASEGSYRPTATTARQVTAASGRTQKPKNGASTTNGAKGARRSSVGGPPPTELESRADQFASDMRAADPNRAAVIHSPWLANKSDDIDHPSWCRIGELVWAKTHDDLARLESMPVFSERAGTRLSSSTARFSHWPAIIRGRTVKISASVHALPQVEYRIEFLALLDQPERTFAAHEVVPWLGYIAAGLTAQEMEDAIKLGGAEVAHSRQWTRDLVSNGVHATRAAFLSAYMTGQFFASIQTRSLPTIETGSHLLPDPEKKESGSLTPLRSMYMARPTTRYLSHAFVFYGPELIHVGDVVRLSSTVELPSSVEAQVIDTSPLQMPTSLVLHVTKLARGGRDCPLIVRGKVYEMNEITIAADDGMPADYVSDDDIFEATVGDKGSSIANGNGHLSSLAASALILNGRQREWARMHGLEDDSSSDDDDDDSEHNDDAISTTSSTRKLVGNGGKSGRAHQHKPKKNASSKTNGGLPHLRKKMPAPPFPAHRWRCLTPGREVDLLMTDIAGRYYPVSPSIYHDDTLVNRIAETAARTGVVGEVGIAPLALLLGGLMSGDKVPRVNAPNGLVGDDRERQLAIAEEQAYITAGLRAAVKPTATTATVNVTKMEVEVPNGVPASMERMQTAVAV